MIRYLALLTLITPAYAADPAIPTMTIHPDPGAMLQALTERGHKAMDSYDDISAARRLLTPAADAGDADAARRIAQTYDPVWLAKAHVIGIGGLADPQQAWAWYRKAAELGDRSAGNRYVQETKR